MKHLYILTVFFFFSVITIEAQTEWTGTPITFTKAGFADWTLGENQDRITNNVWITRASTKGVFNIQQEATYDGSGTSGNSPLDTEWAFGTILDGVGTLTFTTWAVAMDSDPLDKVNQDMVVHLITDDIYIDIKFTSWGQGGAAGGSFEYERSTDQSLSTSEFETIGKLKLFPNPAGQSLQISGLTNNENYTIHNVLGLTVNKGIVSNNERIDIKNLSNGMYFIKFENGNAIKFIKE